MIVWITGISGSGKTTISNRVYNKYKDKFSNLVKVDGDVVREIFGNDLGFDKKSRIEQIKRIQKLCTFLEGQGLIVLVAALYSDNDLMAWNRSNFKNYYEIYLKASIDLVKSRDPKGLYKKFYIGQEQNIVGLDIDYNEPKHYDLKINMDEVFSIEEAFEKIVNNINFPIREYNN